MALLIDGYNLLYAACVVGPGQGPGGLRRARQALLNWLAAVVAPAELPRTTVVFDAAQAPRDLPREFVHRGLTARFASAYADADALLEELIQRDSAPRRLTVVSSDHRLHRAARRRRARAVDSDVWYAEVVRRHAAAQREVQQPRVEAPRERPIGPDEVAYWIRAFDVAEPLPELRCDDDAIFPPGYAEDLET